MFLRLCAACNAHAGSFESYADDVAQLLRHLGLTSVIHIGVSGGGPYACACAALQTHTTAALGLVASMTHCAGPGSFELVQGMDWFNRLGFAFVAYAPGLTQLGLTVAAPFVAAAADAVSELCADISRGSRRGDAGDSCGGGSSSSVMWKAAAFVGGAALLPAPDRHAVLSRPCLCIQALSAAVADAFRQGSRGFFADMRLTASGPWSFDLSSISAPTVVFQGTSDVNVTLPMARWLSHQIPGAELREVVGEAHFSLVLNHAAEVLRVLQDKAVAVAAGGGGSKQEESPSQRLRNGLLAAWQALQCG